MQVVAAELLGETRHRWSQLEPKDRDRVLRLPFVTRVAGAKVCFRPGTERDDTEKELASELRRLTGKCELRYIRAQESPEDKFRQLFYARERFSTISFGSDVAEHDEALLSYFVTTDSFRRLRNREKSIVVGPKGSGKSALLRALDSNLSPGYGIVITPEVFATQCYASSLTRHKTCGTRTKRL
jgi:ATPase subunit of ABC transporter with duplicated ATPase domains